MFTVKPPLEAVQDPQPLAALRATVAEVVAEIHGTVSRAVRDYAEKFASWSPVDFRLNQAALDTILFEAPSQVFVDIKAVAV